MTTDKNDLDDRGLDKHGIDKHGIDKHGIDKHRLAERRAKLLRSATPVNRFEGFIDRLAAGFDLPPARIRELLGAAATAPGAPWRPTGLDKVYRLKVPAGPKLAAARCSLVYLAPGAELPRHGHGGAEWALVLQGSAVEDSGQRFEPGDVLFKPPGSEHALCSVGAEACVFALVLYGDVKLGGQGSTLRA